MTSFCKSEDCPASNELLEFQKGDLAGKPGGDVRRHLASCEFCSAEIEFYSHYPQEDSSGDERIELAGIPAPLFQLAEALLKKKHSDPSSLDGLLKESGLSLDKA